MYLHLKYVSQMTHFWRCDISDSVIERIFRFNSPISKY